MTNGKPDKNVNAENEKNQWPVDGNINKAITDDEDDLKKPPKINNVDANVDLKKANNAAPVIEDLK